MSLLRRVWPAHNKRRDAQPHTRRRDGRGGGRDAPHVSCAEIFARFASQTGTGGGVLAAALIGASWLLVAAGIALMARMIGASVRLKRGIAPFLTPPSPRLAASLSRVGAAFASTGGLPQERFFECAIPPRDCAQ